MTSLPDAPWRYRAGMDRLLAALDAKGGATRFVGGCVRDALLGMEQSDVDLATRLTPVEVIRRLEAAQIKAVPTGIAHGTITAVTAGTPVEVTTLRRDVETDGRRAVVAFSTDWNEDAQRRDFRLNALYADMEGTVFDPTGAGDAFAGGFMAYLARTRSITEDNLRRAMVYGAAMGSYAVEQFGIRGFEEVDLAAIETRVRAFQDLTHVSLAKPLA